MLMSSLKELCVQSHRRDQVQRVVHDTCSSAVYGDASPKRPAKSRNFEMSHRASDIFKVRCRLERIVAFQFKQEIDRKTVEAKEKPFLLVRLPPPAAGGSEIVQESSRRRCLLQ